MLEPFGSYESDIKLAIQEAKTNLSRAASADDATRKQLITSIEASIEESLEIYDQMIIEVQNMPSSKRASYNSKVRQYKNEIDTQKQNLNKLIDSQDKRALFGNRYEDEEAEIGLEGDQQRKQLLSNHGSLERSSERLRDSQRIALETESIGGNILNDLRSQREQIMGARDTLMVADGYVDRSIQTLKSMSRRITANKFISYAIIGVLILLILLVLASKFW